jgi:signal transduction histidine kinase
VLHVVIEDNGHGLGIGGAARGRRGLGIIGMRERAQAFGGSFDIEHRAGSGVRVAVSLPFPRASVGEVAGRQEAV